MCNTFGGVVFIALLLVILSHAMGPSAADGKQLDNRSRQELMAAEQNAELRQLQQQIRILTNMLQKMVVTTSTSRPVSPKPATNGNTAKTNAILRAEIKSQEEELTRMREEIEKNKLLINGNLNNRTNLEHQITQLEKDLQTATNKETRILRLPRLHSIRKNTVFMAVRNGKLCPVSDISSIRSLDRGYDTTHVVVEKGPRHDTVSFRPNRGQQITSGSESEGVFQQMLNNVNKANEYIAFIVFPDSYAEFNYVKNIVVRQQFDYVWRPFEGSVRITKTDSVDAL
jgi:hypothetical protein